MSDTILSRNKQALENWFTKNVLHKKHLCNELTLNHSNIYILPSRLGLVFILFGLLIFVIGSNYQNNLILLVSYFLAAVMLVNFVLAYFNFYNLKISFHSTEPGFSHTHYKINLRLENKRPSFSLIVNCHNGAAVEVDEISKTQQLTIQIKEAKRGRHTLPKISVSSRFPFSLVKVWSYAIFDSSVYVYPTPLPFSIHQANQNQETPDDESDLNTAQLYQGDQYQGLKNYEKGDNINRIAWRQYAKAQTLISKSFTSPISSDYHFSLASVPGDYETKLMHLSFLVQHAENDHLRYSLTLPKTKITLGQGAKHLQLCLEALADA